MSDIRHLLRDIFNDDFSSCATDEAFKRAFFAKTLTLGDLQKTCAFLCQQQLSLPGGAIPAAIAIAGKERAKPFVILAQLHGNEPPGLAGILLAMALSSAGLLAKDAVGVIGNPLAAQQYFSAWEKNPSARQETRDAYRCGLADDGSLLPDMNRIPVDFLARSPSTPHIKRAQELFLLAQQASGIVDIHSARGNMVCITDHKRDADLKSSPIRSVLTGLAEAISAHASAAVTVQTLKTILTPLPNIISQTGIEAGKHEDPKAPHIASSFTLSLLHTLGLTGVSPLEVKETGMFERYAVKPRLSYADLPQEGTLSPDDKIYMAKAKADGSIEQHQYEEMEAIKKGQVVAIALPSNTLFRAPFDFSGIFFSKSSTLYDKDPAVGPWPLPAADLAKVKFCYPCEVVPMRIDFA